MPASLADAYVAALAQKADRLTVGDPTDETNALGPIIVSFSATLGEAMVLESSFSFLGVGVRPPIPSWGNMISDGLRVWQQYPHILAAPAMVLAAATIAFSFLGDGLNDALNPRQWK